MWAIWMSVVDHELLTAQYSDNCLLYIAVNISAVCYLMQAGTWLHAVFQEFIVNLRVYAKSLSAP